MFRFKKSMEGVTKEENFECECCGSMEGQASTGSSGCASGCGPANNSCCGPVSNSCCGPANNSASSGNQQIPGCVPNGAPTADCGCGGLSGKSGVSGGPSGCACGS